MAGIKTTDPGVHGTIIKSTVSKRDGIFDEITCLNLWPGSNPCVLESTGPADHYFESTVSKKDGVVR